MKTTPLLLLMMLLETAVSALATEPIYFLLEDGDDSLIVPMTDTNNIAITRNLIKNGYGSGQPYSDAFPDMTIVPGRDGLNRNYLDPTMPEWSWHVQMFVAFAGAVANITSATWLERQYDWKNDPPPRVSTAFLYYQFTREFGPTPLFVNVRTVGKNFDVYWSTPLTNGLYTLQQNPGFASNAWTSVPGFSWPITTNHVTFALTNATSLNFRVVAN